MRVLIDHCVPRRFKRLLVGHQTAAAYELGWAGLKNGDLLRQAADRFDVFLTVDQNVQFQQNLAALPLAVIILAAPDNRFATLEPYAPKVMEVLAQRLGRELVRIESPERVIRVAGRTGQP